MAAMNIPYAFYYTLNYNGVYIIGDPVILTHPKYHEYIEKHRHNHGLIMDGLINVPLRTNRRNITDNCNNNYINVSGAFAVIAFDLLKDDFKQNLHLIKGIGSILQPIGFNRQLYADNGVLKIYGPCEINIYNLARNYYMCIDGSYMTNR